MLSFPQCCGTSVTKHQLRRSYKANRFISRQDAKEHSDSYRDAKFSYVLVLNLAPLRDTQTTTEKL